MCWEVPIRAPKTCTRYYQALANMLQYNENSDKCNNNVKVCARGLHEQIDVHLGFLAWMMFDVTYDMEQDKWKDHVRPALPFWKSRRKNAMPTDAITMPCKFRIGVQSLNTLWFQKDFQLHPPPALQRNCIDFPTSESKFLYRDNKVVFPKPSPWNKPPNQPAWRMTASILIQDPDTKRTRFIRTKHNMQQLFCLYK